MRKTAAVLIIVMIWLGTNPLSAQDSGFGGGFSAELNCDLFVIDEISITPTFLKLRYFVNDNIAVRLSTWFDFSSNQQVPETTMNYSFFSLRPGAEYHLASQKGVFSAYVGLEAIINHANYNLDTKVGVPVTGAWSNIGLQNFENRAYKTYGAGIFGGADVFLSSNFFIGTELGFAYLNTTHAPVELGNDLFLDKSKTATFGIDLSRIFRVGFLIGGQGNASLL